MNNKITIECSLNIKKETGKREWEIEVFNEYDRVYYRAFSNSDAFMRKVDFIKDVVKSYEDGECSLEDLLETF